MLSNTKIKDSSMSYHQTTAKKNTSTNKASKVLINLKTITFNI